MADIGNDRGGAAHQEPKNPKLYAFLVTIREWIANWKLPCGNGVVGNLIDKGDAKLSNPKSHRRIILVIVCIALLLDNMLYMVIVPIMPAMYDKVTNTTGTENATGTDNATMMDNTIMMDNATMMDNASVTIKEPDNIITRSTAWLAQPYIKNKDINIGMLFACKAIFQLFANPFTGTLMDRIGYEVPMMIGLSIIFFSTTMFAFGGSYAALFIARSLQGVGSAFADTSGFALIADIYTDDAERSAALGIAQAFISFGCLVAPPFGGALYEVSGQPLPFLLLALLALVAGVMMLFATGPVRKHRREMKVANKQLKGTPIYKLIVDPYIATCAGCLVMANVSLAFIEPTIALWMKHTMKAPEWQIGMAWLPAFIPHVFGVFMTVKLAERYPSKQWIMGGVGLALEGVSCMIIPYCKSFGTLMVPLCILCFGIALVDTSILPLMGHLVDVRHVSVYGSVYAIVDISYCIAYAIGPIVAGQIVQSIGFTALNAGIFVSNILYAPLMLFLRKAYDYQKFVPSEEEVVMDTGTPSHKMYSTYTAGSDDHGLNTDLSEHVVMKAAGGNFNDSDSSSEEEDDDDEGQGGYGGVTETTPLKSIPPSSSGGLAGAQRPGAVTDMRPVPKPRQASVDLTAATEHRNSSSDSNRSTDSGSASESEY